MIGNGGGTSKFNMGWVCVWPLSFEDGGGAQYMGPDIFGSMFGQMGEEVRGGWGMLLLMKWWELEKACCVVVGIMLDQMYGQLALL